MPRRRRYYLWSYVHEVFVWTVYLSFFISVPRHLSYMGKNTVRKQSWAQPHGNPIKTRVTGYFHTDGDLRPEGARQRSSSERGTAEAVLQGQNSELHRWILLLKDQRACCNGMKWNSTLKDLRTLWSKIEIGAEQMTSWLVTSSGYWAPDANTLWAVRIPWCSPGGDEGG